MMSSSQTNDVEKNGPPSDDHVNRVKQQVQEVKTVSNIIRIPTFINPSVDYGRKRCTSYGTW